ncbi:MAG: hypothetical protein KVP17_000655 [Porospora cf. gigantea B]|uniref:uncharacterized protein n=2 Tax=Porospora cf. gigantea B TaxID=2853592 RepID=UPI003571B3ED|nr:MAG: hypothetical protein KVP17_000655 [Porospora cf. gigantea B]
MFQLTQLKGLVHLQPSNSHCYINPGNSNLDVGGGGLNSLFKGELLAAGQRTEQYRDFLWHCRRHVRPLVVYNQSVSEFDVTSVTEDLPYFLSRATFGCIDPNAPEGFVCLCIFRECYTPKHPLNKGMVYTVGPVRHMKLEAYRRVLLLTGFLLAKVLDIHNLRCADEEGIDTVVVVNISSGFNLHRGSSPPQNAALLTEGIAKYVPFNPTIRHAFHVTAEFVVDHADNSDSDTSEESR